MSAVHKSSSIIAWDAPAGNIDAYNARVYLPGADPNVATPQSQATVSAVDPDEPATQITADELFANVITEGDYDIYVRAKDSAGYWGPFSAVLPVTLVFGPEAPTNLGVL